MLLKPGAKGYLLGAVVALRSVVPCGDFLYRSSCVLVELI